MHLLTFINAAYDNNITSNNIEQPMDGNKSLEDEYCDIKAFQKKWFGHDEIKPFQRDQHHQHLLQDINRRQNQNRIDELEQVLNDMEQIKHQNQSQNGQSLRNKTNGLRKRKPSSSKIDAIYNELNKSKELQTDMIKRYCDKMDEQYQLERLVETSLGDNSFVFNKRAKQKRSDSLWRYRKCVLVFLLIMLIVVVSIIKVSNLIL